MPINAAPIGVSLENQTNFRLENGCALLGETKLFMPACW